MGYDHLLPDAAPHFDEGLNHFWPVHMVNHPTLAWPQLTEAYCFLLHRYSPLHQCSQLHRSAP